MNKVLVIGIIGGIIGIVAIFGGLTANLEHQRVMADHLIASSYYSEINEFLIEACLELEIGFVPDQFDSLEQRLQHIDAFQQEAKRIDSLRQGIKNFQQKYSGTENYAMFDFQIYGCPEE